MNLAKKLCTIYFRVNKLLMPSPARNLNKTSPNLHVREIRIYLQRNNSILFRYRQDPYRSDRET